jgi:hypothetical protein
MAKRRKIKQKELDTDSPIIPFEIDSQKRKSFKIISQTFSKIFRRVSVWIAILSMIQYRYWTGKIRLLN